jgi:hypothetical protein
MGGASAHVERFKHSQAAVLIRPHPSRAAEWEGVDWRSVQGVTLYGGNPIDEESRADYFDSLYHSTAVVGLNTSAFIEGRHCRPSGDGDSSGTVPFKPGRHPAFRYLTDVGGGLLTTSRSLEEHERQLTVILGGGVGMVLARQAEFVRAFVRPRGLDKAATPILAEAIEHLPEDARGLSVPRTTPTVAADSVSRAAGAAAHARDPTVVP